MIEKCSNRRLGTRRKICRQTHYRKLSKKKMLLKVESAMMIVVENSDGGSYDISTWPPHHKKDDFASVFCLLTNERFRWIAIAKQSKEWHQGVGEEQFVKLQVNHVDAMRRVRDFLTLLFLWRTTRKSSFLRMKRGALQISARSFSAPSTGPLPAHARRLWGLPGCALAWCFRATTQQILAGWFEWLCSLAGSCLLKDRPNSSSFSSNL